jgi:hypothetical protein
MRFLHPTGWRQVGLFSFRRREVLTASRKHGTISFANVGVTVGVSDSAVLCDIDMLWPCFLGFAKGGILCL